MKHQPGPGDNRPPRRSRLVAAAVVLAIVVVGGELFWFLRSSPRTRGEASPTAEAPALVSPSNPRPHLPADQLHRAPEAVALAAAPDSETDAADESRAPTAVIAALRKHDLLLAAHSQQAIQEADESTFARLNLPDQQRVAIRLLNEREARRRQELIAAERDDLTPEEQAGASIAIGDKLVRERLDGIKELLGPEAAQTFQIAETSEIRRLQRRYRLLWAQELDQQAPLPAGLPARAH